MLYLSWKEPKEHVSIVWLVNSQVSWIALHASVNALGRNKLYTAFERCNMSHFKEIIEVDKQSTNAMIKLKS